MSAVMNPPDLVKLQDYINVKIDSFRQLRIGSLNKIYLEDLLTMDSHLFKARHIHIANELISLLMDEHLTISEEKLFEDFLVGLALFVTKSTFDGHNSSAPGVDLEFTNNGVHYLVSIKPGPRWGNGFSRDRLKSDLNSAVKNFIQINPGMKPQPVFGLCFGKAKTNTFNGCLKVVGKDFWYLISGDEKLYNDIIEPIYSCAREKNDFYCKEKSAAENRFTSQFIDRFCDQDFKIDWVKLVEFNSGNLDLDRFLP
jgi:hypothetical protein